MQRPDEALRAIVDSCPEGGPLLCRHADGTPGLLRVALTTGTADEPFDNSALRPLLRPGMRVNLVDTATDADGTLRARFIVAEPDYLVNVTAVAACMADYGDGPLVGLLRRLAPAPSSQAIVMGNFAGMLLDEALHPSMRTKPYAESVRDFFRGAALSIMALGPDFRSRDFHTEALAQQAHIRHAVDTQLPALAEGFSPREAVVEPSFFCEALGLQGRMDCLTLDGSVVVEQKSGKAAFGSSLPARPLLRRDHYAQLLLYRAALRYGHPRTKARAFLMYSKYAAPLVAAGRSEHALQHAMALRNRLALAELGYASEGFGALRGLTPDMLNTRGATGRLWTDYQRPQLEAVLAPLQRADAAEQAYFLRMMRFAALEHRLAKLGARPADGTGFASAWQTTPEARRDAGIMVDGLRLLSPAEGHEGSVSSIELSLADDIANDSTNFRPNDIVLLYSYAPDAAPDLRRALPLRCILRSIGGGRVGLELRTPQSDARVLLDARSRLWAIEHDFIESAADDRLRGLHALLCAPAERRSLLLGRRLPLRDPQQTLRGDYGDFNPVVLAARRARELFLVVGPPGTGKTSHGLMGIVREELTDPSATILLTAYTNRAVDEICLKLAEASIPFVRLGQASTCPPFCRDRTISAIVETATDLGDVRSALASARIFAGTTAAVNARIDLLQARRFTLAVVDEASQILEPQLAALFAATCAADGRPSVERFVLIGDHKQLPAVVRQSPEQSRILEPELRALGFDNCRVSLFERLYRRYAGIPGLSCMLTRQGRMHPDIAAFPSRVFYSGRLQAVPLPHQQAPSPRSRVRFVAVEPPASTPSPKVNTAEAECIASIVAAVRSAEGERFDPATSIGVIVPYRNQIAAVRAAMTARGVAEAADITVDTVERFQGSQREHIVYGTTVSTPSQLDFLCESVMTDPDDGSTVDRRLNVALTRAREYLTIVGCPAVLRLDPVYASLLAALGAGA